MLGILLAPMSVLGWAIQGNFNPQSVKVQFGVPEQRYDELITEQEEEEELALGRCMLLTANRPAPLWQGALGPWRGAFPLVLGLRNSANHH